MYRSASGDCEQETREEEAMKLGLACQEWGFFQLVNHGISDEVIERMKYEIQDQYSLELERIKSILLSSMSKNLGAEGLADMFKDGMQSVRINYYPPCHHSSKVLGLSPHSDGSGLTLLLQVNQVEGLQIKKNGRWLPIKPLSSAFIVNIDTLEIMSHGKYKSIEHRLVINPEKERMSITTFCMPRLDVGSRFNSQARGRK
ncbi:hypothetical protein J5N97_029574 [Dioscorea zingiberensis]|uniref:Fe2OG dioxygenase domain-containing protein n=1 Tax=Dioscorea zingiberensis TaxID=325984 RepID=A0A9D5BVZ8_9LILI|nr:hypothetical protein J5N97_029574 [Dioscorea zingiberensis]